MSGHVTEFLQNSKENTKGLKTQSTKLNKKTEWANIQMRYSNEVFNLNKNTSY